MLEINPVNEEYEDVHIENEKVHTDEDIVRCNVKVKRKFLKDYDALCKKKGMTRSKRLRNFMEFELKKDEIAKAEAQKIQEEKAKIEAQTKSEEVIFDPFADHSADNSNNMNESSKPNDGFSNNMNQSSKPKGLNTSDSEN